MPAQGEVVGIVNPRVAVAAIDTAQMDVPTGVHQLVVATLAQGHQLAVALDSLAQAGTDFILEQSGREIWRAELPIADVNPLIEGINGQTANLEATSDGHWLTITSTVPGTSQSLRITLDGITAKVTEKQPATDASMTLDGVVVACIGNVGRAAGLQLEAVSVGTTSITAAEANLPGYMFPLVVSYLIALIVLVILYKVEPGHMFRWLPSQLGPVPLSVPLFGAIGAVIISLQGLFAHGHEWLPSYNLWHIARPLVGAVVGVVAVLFLIVLIDAAQASSTNATTHPTTTTTPTTTSTTASALEASRPSTATLSAIDPVSSTTTTTISPANSAPGSGSVGGLSAVIVYDVIAFIVGYREETFRNLLTRVTDVILGPSGMTGNVGTTS